MGQITHMDHSEAVEQMATERYLLNELSPELRDAFEEHLFDCPECALDLSAAEAFVTEAKIQLPELTTSAPSRVESPRVANSTKKSMFAWLRPFFANPAFAAPVFATLLAILGYQNFVTYPALQVAANQPRITPFVSLHAVTRDAAHVTVIADKERGVTLLIDVAQQSEASAYSFDLADAQGKSIWAHTLPADQVTVDDGTLSLLIPGAGIHQGAYTLSVFAVTPARQRTKIQRYLLDIQMAR